MIKSLDTAGFTVMDSEVIAAFIGGGCALVGVAIGAAGTIGTARMQNRGVTAQADAMLRQAEATYGAALDQAQATHHAAHEQWRRGVQRDAYAGFIAALDEAERLISQPELLDTEVPGGVRTSLAAASRALRAAHAILELEGPQRLVALATTARESCLELTTSAEGLAPRARALRILAAAIDTTVAERSAPQSSASLALAAHLAITQLREAAHQHDTGRIDQAAYHEAHERASASLEACGLLTMEEVRAVLADPSWERALRRGSRHADAAERLAEARTAFVEAARDHLASGPRPVS
ncbi:hypothetical protein [Streptomyces sp. NPDC059863]|uniref:hypothetical protein n=1 Tax=unclassified Streptomyces TaxID=2593676 RepID=UPI00364EA4CE